MTEGSLSIQEKTEEHFQLMRTAGETEISGTARCPQVQDDVFGQSGRQDCLRLGQPGCYWNLDKDGSAWLGYCGGNLKTQRKRREEEERHTDHGT